MGDLLLDEPGSNIEMQHSYPQPHDVIHAPWCKPPACHHHSGASNRPAEKTASVRAFFLHMYWSSAEPMTKEFLNCILSGTTFWWQPFSFNVISYYDYYVVMCFKYGILTQFRIATKTNMKQADDDLRDQLMQRLVDAHLMSPYLQLSFNSDPARLPLRELPHGSWTELFLVYKSFCRVKNEGHASKALFFSVAKEWRKCLRFRKESDHAQCATCSRLRSLLQSATDTWLKVTMLNWWLWG